jgi:predicted transcriptional regulator
MGLTSFDIYIRYKTVISLLEKKHYSTKKLSDETKICRSTIHKMINDLIDNNVVEVKGSRFLSDNNCRHERVFGLVK